MKRCVPFAIACLAGLHACAPAAQPPVAPQPVPAAFPASGEGPSTGSLQWTQFFDDKELIYLIYDTLKGNPDLQMALQRVEIARSAVRQRDGALLPQLSAVGGAGVARWGRYTPEGAGNTTTDLTPGRAVPNPVGDFSAGLVASWEVDAWGKLRSERGAALARYLATAEARRVVQTVLISEVAATYFELLAWDVAREILQETIVRQRRAVEAAELQKAAGRATELAVQQFAAQLRETEALAVQTGLQIQETESRINLMRGEYPKPVRRTPHALLQELELEASAGLPSEVLRQRPDVRQAEQLVRAAKLDLSAARAAFYPELTLSAGVGFQAFDPRYLLRIPESVVYSATLGLLVPLVNRSAIEAEFQAAEAHQVEAMIYYQKTVLTAYAEVTLALARLEATRTITEVKEQQRAILERSLDTAHELYRANRATYLDVLLAQQNVLSAELDLVEARKQSRLAAVGLYRALGGGGH